MKVYMSTLSTCSLQVQQFLLPLLKSFVTWSIASPITHQVTRFLMVRTPAGNFEHWPPIFNNSFTTKMQIVHLYNFISPLLGGC